MVRDNIIGSSDKAQLVIFTGKDSANNRIDGNFYVGAGVSKVGIGVAVTRDNSYTPTHKEMLGLRATGIEANGSEGDPGWTDVGRGDLRLRGGSPAKGKG